MYNVYIVYLTLDYFQAVGINDYKLLNTKVCLYILARYILSKILYYLVKNPNEDEGGKTKKGKEKKRKLYHELMGMACLHQPQANPPGKVEYG